MKKRIIAGILVALLLVNSGINGTFATSENENDIAGTEAEMTVEEEATDEEITIAQEEETIDEEATIAAEEEATNDEAVLIAEEDESTDETGTLEDNVNSVVYVGTVHGESVESYTAGITPEYPYKSIQDAYDAVSDGGTIYVVDQLEVANWASYTSGWDKESKNVTIMGYTGEVKLDKNGNTETYDPVIIATGNWILCGDTTFENLTMESSEMRYLQPRGYRLQIGSGAVVEGASADKSGVEPRVRDTSLKYRNADGTTSDDQIWLYILTNPYDFVTGEYITDESMEKIDIHIYGTNYINIIADVKNSKDSAAQSTGMVLTPNLQTATFELIGSSESKPVTLQTSSNNYYNGMMPAFEPSTLQSVNYTLAYTNVTDKEVLFRCANDGTLRRLNPGSFTVNYLLDHFVTSADSIYYGDCYTTGDVTLDIYNSKLTGRSTSLKAASANGGRFGNGVINLYDTQIRGVGINADARNSSFQAMSMTYNLYGSTVITDYLMAQDNTTVNITSGAADNAVTKIRYFPTEDNGKDESSIMTFKVQRDYTLPTIYYAYGGHVDLVVDNGVTLTLEEKEDNINNVTNNGTIITKSDEHWYGYYIGGAGSILQLQAGKSVQIDGTVSGSTTARLESIPTTDFLSSISSASGVESCITWSADDNGIDNLKLLNTDAYWSIYNTKDYSKADCVYLRNGGSDNWSDNVIGSSYMYAVKSVEKAYELAVGTASGGGNKKIVLCSPYYYDTANWEFGSKISEEIKNRVTEPVILTSNDGENDFAELFAARLVSVGTAELKKSTGASDRYFSINASFRFDNITFDYDRTGGGEYYGIACNGYQTVFGDNVTINGKVYLSGGTKEDNEKITKTDLTVYSGTFINVSASGNYTAVMSNATDVNLKVYGGTITNIWGGNLSDKNGRTVNITVDGTQGYTIDGLEKICGFGYSGTDEMGATFYGDVNLNVDGVTLNSIVGGSQNARSAAWKNHGTVIMNIGKNGYVKVDQIYAYVLQRNNSTGKFAGYDFPKDFYAEINLYNVSCDNIATHSAAVLSETSRKQISLNYYDWTRSAEDEDTVCAAINWNDIGTVTIQSKVSYSNDAMKINNLTVENGTLYMLGSTPTVAAEYTGSNANLVLNDYTTLTFTGKVNGTTTVESYTGKAFDIYSNSDESYTINGKDAFAGDGISCETTDSQLHWHFTPEENDLLDVVYVDGVNGDDKYDGSTATVSGANGPVKTLERAYEQLKDGGTIILCGNLEISGWPRNTKAATLTSDASLAECNDKTDYSSTASLTFTPAGDALADRYLALAGDLTMRRLNFYYNFASGSFGGIDANGHKLQIGSTDDKDVTVNFYKTGTTELDDYFVITGGGAVTNQVSAVDLELYNVKVGFVTAIYGSSASATATQINGNVTLIVDDCTVSKDGRLLYCAYEDNFQSFIKKQGDDYSGYATVNGDVNLQVINTREKGTARLIKGFGNSSTYGKVKVLYQNSAAKASSHNCGSVVLPHAKDDVELVYDGQFDIVDMKVGNNKEKNNKGEETNYVVTFMGKMSLTWHKSVTSGNNSTVNEIINYGTKEKPLELTNNSFNVNRSPLYFASYHYKSVTVNYYGGDVSEFAFTPHDGRLLSNENQRAVIVLHNVSTDAANPTTYTVNRSDFADKVELKVVDGAKLIQQADTSDYTYDLTLENGGIYEYKGSENELVGIRNLTMTGEASKLIYDSDIICSGEAVIDNGAAVDLATSFMAESISGTDGTLNMKNGTYAIFDTIKSDCVLKVNAVDGNVANGGFYIHSANNDKEENDKASAFTGESIKLEYSVDSDGYTWSFGTTNYIYLDTNTGNDAKDGRTPVKAKKTLQSALEEAASEIQASKGATIPTIVICGKYTFDPADTITLTEEAQKLLAENQIVITQAVRSADESTVIRYKNTVTVITGFTLPCNIQFQNITLTCEAKDAKESPSIYANGYLLTMGEGVTTKASKGVLPTIYGGGSLGDVENTHLQVYSGTWYRIYGGGFNGNVTGNTEIELGGTEGSALILTTGTEDGNFVNDSTYAVFGGGEYGTVGGNTTITVNSGTQYNYIFGGGNNLSATVKGDTTVQVDNSGVVIPRIYGGGYAANVVGTANVNFLSGTVNRIYGAGVAEGTTTGAANVVIGGSSDTANTATVRQYLRGSGDQGAVSGTATLTIKDGAVLEKDCSAAAGGYKGGVGKSVLDIQGGTINCDIYAGGCGATKANSTEINTEVGNVSASELKISGGTVNANVFAGGNMGYVGNASDSTGADGTTTDVTTVSITGGTVNGSVYGGCNMATTYGNITLDLTDGNMVKVFGGGKGTDTVAAIVTGNTTANIAGSGVTGGIYGGCDTNGTVVHTGVNATTIPACNIFGAGYGEKTSVSSVSVTLNAEGASNDYAVYGGGEQGQVTGSTTVTATKWAGDIYGGGKGGAKAGTTTKVESADITINGSVAGSIYGGGYGANTDTTSTNVRIQNGTVSGNVYGGSGFGHVETANVTVKEALDIADARIVVEKNVFGGGFGESSVTKDTHVTVDMALNIDLAQAGADCDLLITAQEEETIQDEASSGETKATCAWQGNRENEVSVIRGDVYGGGDMGRIGDGTINTGINEAEIDTVGTTEVEIQNGYIRGSVFGGGNGVPTNTSYTVYMGTVFGSSSTRVTGGYISGSVYGCGNQSRTYATNDGTAAVLTMEEVKDETEATSTQGRPIVIGTSIFGGGNKGDSATVNASVYTVVGSTTVNIVGLESADNPTAIYFLSENKGGVYGDGNLCLVNGIRTVNITNFNRGKENLNAQLKTFYSLQRADVVNLENTRIVLEGAEDLVDENAGTTLYSINRVGQLNMKKNSAIKLTEIVNLLGGLSSDCNTGTTYIDKGNNGSNGYTNRGGNLDAEVITQEREDAYREAYEAFVNSKGVTTPTDDNLDTVSFNVVCVANGKYLEVKKTDTQYGNVTGMFILQLLHATKGEGGGFVYANIGEKDAEDELGKGSTGDFICVTQKGIVNEQTNSSVYMKVVDNVGGYDSVTNDYTYYYWYIKGGNMNYNVHLNGYIGTSESTFSESVMLPTLFEGKTMNDTYYVLRSVTGAEDKDPTTEQNAGDRFNRDRLVSSWNDAYENGDYYAIEVKASAVLQMQDSAGNMTKTVEEKSIGYLAWDEATGWSLLGTARTAGAKDDTGNENPKSYLGTNDADAKGDIIEQNVIYTVPRGTEIEALYLKLVLHKGTGVSVEIKDVLNIITLDIKADSYDSVSGDDTSELVIKNYTSITRIVPTQAAYMSSGRQYVGVASDSPATITQNSAFTVQYITRYVPSAFSGDVTETLTLDVNEKYLWSENTGVGFTVVDNTTDGTGTVDLIAVTKGAMADYEGKIKKTESGYVLSSEEGNSTTEDLMCLNTETAQSYFPKGTTITLVAKIDDNAPTYWYYYCKEEQTTEIPLSEFVQMNTADDAASKATYSLTKASGGRVSAGTSNRITENLIFVVDFADISPDANNSVSGRMQLKHGYLSGGEYRDIMDYVTEEIKTENATSGMQYKRTSPAISNVFQVEPTKTGISDFTFSVSSSSNAGTDNTSGSAVCYEKDVLTAAITITPDSSVMNTQYDEREYAVLLTLEQKNDATQSASGYTACAFPEGTVFLFRGERLEANTNNAGVIIPVKKTGTHELQIETSLSGYDCGEYRLTATLYSASAANYHNSLTTKWQAETTFTVVASPTYALSVTAGDTDASRIVSAGNSLDITVKAVYASGGTSSGSTTGNKESGNGSTTAESGVTVALYQYQKDSTGATAGSYKPMDTGTIFTAEVSTIAADSAGTSWKPIIRDGAAPGTYRLEFTYGDKKEYLDFILAVQ